MHKFNLDFKSLATSKLDFNYFHQKPNLVLSTNKSEKPAANFSPNSSELKYTHFALFVSVRNSQVSIHSEGNVNINLIIPNPQNGNMITLYE